MAAWEPKEALGYLSQSAQVFLELPCSRPLHAYKIQTETGILKELGSQLDNAKAADKKYRKSWGQKMLRA